MPFLGLAFGLSQQNAILAVQTAVDKKYMAVATSLVSYSFRNPFLLLSSILIMYMLKKKMQKREKE